MDFQKGKKTKEKYKRKKKERAHRNVIKLR